jgi:hypothetical protein
MTRDPKQSTAPIQLHSAGKGADTTAVDRRGVPTGVAIQIQHFSTTRAYLGDRSVRLDRPSGR